MSSQDGLQHYAIILQGQSSCSEGLKNTLGEIVKLSLFICVSQAGESELEDDDVVAEPSEDHPDQEKNQYLTVY